MTMAKQNEFVQFTHETKFDVSKFDDYSFHQPYDGPIFCTSHGGIGYKWRTYIYPNGSRYRSQLANGEVLESKEDRKNVSYYLRLLGGPLSAVDAGCSLKVKPSNNTATVVHHLDWLTKSKLFDRNHHWGDFIATKGQLEGDGSLEGGFLTVITKIKLSSDLFDPAHIVSKIKAQITEDKENVIPVPRAFFDMIDKEPACGVPLKLFVGHAKIVFFCVHQVLEMNSAYFHNLLHSGPQFKENKESKIEFFGLDPEGVRAALRYIYLKELPDNFKEVAEVCLPAAHLFLLPNLVLECEKVLISDLSAENDVDMALLAQTYDLSLLKNMALNSMALRYDDVRKNSRFVEKLQNKNTLLDDLVEAVACHARSESGIIT